MEGIDWAKIGGATGSLAFSVVWLARYIRSQWRDRLEGYKRILGEKEKRIADLEKEKDELFERLITPEKK